MLPPITDPFAPLYGAITAADVANATCYQLDGCASADACAVNSLGLAAGASAGPAPGPVPVSTSAPAQAASDSRVAWQAELTAQLPSAKPQKEAASWYLTPVQSRVPASVVQAYGLTDALALLQGTRSPPVPCEQPQAGSTAAWYEQRRTRKAASTDAVGQELAAPHAVEVVEPSKATEQTKKRRRTKSKHAGLHSAPLATPVQSFDLFAE